MKKNDSKKLQKVNEAKTGKNYQERFFRGNHELNKFLNQENIDFQEELFHFMRYLIFSHSKDDIFKLIQKSPNTIKFSEFSKNCSER